MFTEQKKKSGFGLGIAVRGRGDALEVSHGGSNEGFRCTLVYYPERGEGAVVMTNSDNGAAVGTEVLHALARHFGWSGYKPYEIDPIDVSAATLQQYAGEYPMPDMPMDLVISFENDKLFMTFNNSRQEIVPVDEDEFESVMGGRIYFERDAGGKVATLSLDG